MTGIADDVAAELRAKLSGRVVTAGDVDYDSVRMVFRGEFDGHPGAIARVASAKDIATVIALARETGLPLSVRSGGHSSTGASTNDGGLVIDLRDMTNLDFDEATQTVWAQTGLSAFEMSQAAWNRGLAIGFGDTGSVGIGGITLGGGIGYLTRKHGMTIDNLLAAEIVTADGELVAADEHTNPTSSGRSAAAAATSAWRHASNTSSGPMPSFTGGLMVLPATADSIAGFMDAAREAPDGLGTIANVMPCPPLPFVPDDLHGKLVIFALVGFDGGEEEADRAIAPIRALGPIADMVKPDAVPGHVSARGHRRTDRRRSTTRSSWTTSIGPRRRRSSTGSRHQTLR